VSSVFADQGTAAHHVLELCLQSTYQMGWTITPQSFIGQTIPIEDGYHSPRSPSGAKRWLNCTASVAFTEQYPSEIGPGRQVTVEAEDAEAVQVCLDYVAQRVGELKQEYHEVIVIPERRVSLEPVLGHKDCDGTSDITILCIDEVRTLLFVEHVDYKHGTGVFVAEDDPQNDLYWLGTLCEEGADKFVNRLLGTRLTIVQPRYPSAPAVRWRDIEDPQALFTDVQAKISNAEKQILTGQGEYHAGEWCRWCPVGGDGGKDGRPVCAAYTRQALAAAGFGDADEPLPTNGNGTLAQDLIQASARDPAVLSPAQLVGILDAREAIRGMLEAAEEFALQELMSDSPPPELATRYKPVSGRTQRKWMASDEEAVFAALKKIKIHDAEKDKERGLGKKDLYTEKLKSPAQVEKVLKAGGLARDDTRFRVFEELVDKPKGKPTLAPIEDPREAITKPKADDVFGEIDWSE